MNTEEVWKIIPRFEGRYEASSLGRFRNANSRLTEEDIKNIRILRKAGVSRSEVATRYDLPPAYVSEITAYKVWRDV